MDNPSGNNGWNEHKLAVYGKLDNLDEKIQHNTNTNAKQYDILKEIRESIGDMHGDMKVFKFKIAGIASVLSAIVAFIMKHLG